MKTGSNTTMIIAADTQ